jgi:hypothetical protein
VRWGGNQKTVRAWVPHKCGACGSWVWLEKIWRQSRSIWRCIPCDTREMLEREAQQEQNQMLKQIYPGSWYPWVEPLGSTNAPTNN